jgi:hypothetical protein
MRRRQYVAYLMPVFIGLKLPIINRPMQFNVSTVRTLWRVILRKFA